MRFMAIIMFVAILAVLYLRMRKDIAEYNEFKKLQATKDRQQKYRNWALQSFLFFGLGSLVGLGIIGHLGNLAHPISELANAVPKISIDTSNSGGAFYVGILFGIAIWGALIGFLISRSKKKKNATPKKAVVMGDVEALLPRNRQEEGWAALLALNAGFSEELFFRVFIPALAYVIFGNAVVAIVVAIVLFGLVHIYQGWVGVLGTSLMGAFLMFVYLASGYIWLAMLLHALIDISSLIVQPRARKRFTSR